MRNLLNILLITTGLSVSAQSVSQAPINPVQQSGYYKIKISPEVRGELKTNYFDLRVSNAEGDHQPYILKRGKEIVRTQRFETFEMDTFLHQKRRRYDWGYYSEVILKNKQEIALDELYMEINNARVKKKIRLSGSDNGKDWFVITNNCRYNIQESSKTTQMIKLLDFPIVSYPFIKVIIRDYSIDPLKINKVGYFVEEVRNLPKDTCVFKSIVKQEANKAKTTRFRVSLKQGYYLDYLKLDLAGVQFYNRRVHVLISDTVRYKKTIKVVDKKLSSGWVNSKHQNVLSLPNQKLNEFILEIENEDNAELSLVQLKGLCIPSYVISELTADQDYHLEMGDQELQRPNYDLVHFEKDIQVNPKEVFTQLPAKNGKVKQARDEKEIPEWITWSIIGFVMILLMFFSIKMIREMKEG